MYTINRDILPLKAPIILIKNHNKYHNTSRIKSVVLYWCKLQLWRGRLFSIGGRELLIKSVAQSVPTYTMSVFRLSVSLCEDIQSMVAKFWWGGEDDAKKMHWWSWMNFVAERKMAAWDFMIF